MRRRCNARNVTIFRTVRACRRSLIAFPMMVVSVVVTMVRLVLWVWFWFVLSKMIPLIWLLMSYAITLIVIMLMVWLVRLVIYSGLFFVIVVTIDITLIGGIRSAALIVTVTVVTVLLSSCSSSFI